MTRRENQFEGLRYFRVGTDSAPSKPVFNRTVTLRDTWVKIERGLEAGRLEGRPVVRSANMKRLAAYDIPSNGLLTPRPPLLRT